MPNNVKLFAGAAPIKCYVGASAAVRLYVGGSLVFDANAPQSSAQSSASSVIARSSASSATANQFSSSGVLSQVSQSSSSGSIDNSSALSSSNSSSSGADGISAVSSESSLTEVIQNSSSSAFDAVALSSSSSSVGVAGDAPSPGYTVSGAGDSSYNGVYCLNAALTAARGSNVYKHQTNDRYIYFGGDFTWIGKVVGNIYGDSDGYYASGEAEPLPGSGAWSAYSCCGTELGAPPSAVATTTCGNSQPNYSSSSQITESGTSSDSSLSNFDVSSSSSAAGVYSESSSSSDTAPPAAITGTFYSIPIMTSNTTPSGIATVSAAESDLVDQANRAFDGPDAVYGVWPTWRTKPTSQGGALPQYAQYDFVNKQSLIGGYSITVYGENLAGNRPAAWTFSGSDDGVNFVQLDTRNTPPPISGSRTTTEYLLSAPAKYRIYRWTITAGENPAIVDIMNLGLLRYIDQTQPLPTITQQPENNFSATASDPATFSVAATSSAPGDLTYQWQYYGYDDNYTTLKWRDIPSQTNSSISISPSTVSSLGINVDYYQADVQLRCIIYGPANAGGVTSAAVRWINLTQIGQVYSDFFGVDGGYPTGSVTIAGRYYSIISLQATEQLSINGYDMAFGGIDTSWYSNNAYTVKLQVSDDADTWTDVSSTSFKSAIYYSTTVPANTGVQKYYRLMLQFNWPLTATNGTNAAQRTAPAATFIGGARVTWA